MSNLKKVTLSLQKIKSKNLGQNQENLVTYLVKDYSFTNKEAETLISDAAQTNVIRSIKFNGKTSYRIVKPDTVCDDTVLVSDTQVKTEEDVIAGNTIVLNETTDSFNEGSCNKHQKNR